MLRGRKVVKVEPYQGVTGFELVKIVGSIRGCLSVAEKAVLHRLAESYPIVFPSVDTIAAETSCSERAVQYALRALESDGWITDLSSPRDANNVPRRVGGRNHSIQYALNVPKILDAAQRNANVPSETVQQTVQSAEINGATGAPFVDKRCTPCTLSNGNGAISTGNGASLAPEERSKKEEKRERPEQTSPVSKPAGKSNVVQKVNTTPATAASSESEQPVQSHSLPDPVAVAIGLNPRVNFSRKDKDALDKLVREIKPTSAELTAAIKQTLSNLDDFELKHAGSILSVKLAALINSIRNQQREKSLEARLLAYYERPDVQARLDREHVDRMKALAAEYTSKC